MFNLANLAPPGYFSKDIKINQDSDILEIKKRLHELESQSFIFYPELHKEHPALEHAFNALTDSFEQYELIRKFVTSKGKQ